MSLELDYMEYASDGAAQTAYPSSDPNVDSYTKLLLHCNGEDESQSFPDSSPSNHTVTANDNAQVDTDHKKFGTASGLFDGIGDYLSIPDHADFDFGTGDWTIDTWIRFSSVASHNFIIGSDISGFTIMQKEPDNELNVYATWAGSNRFAWTPVIDTWYHLAVTRSGNTLRAFIDGTQIGGDIDVTGKSYNSNNIHIGGSSGLTQYLSGWLDEFRVSKGIARWTANFTPPDREYTQPFQCYSEDTIKQQGSYSLECFAMKISALNDYLQRTPGTPINLSNKNTIKFDIRALRTGSNIKIGIHDSGGVTTEITPNVIQVDTWQTVEWDISGVSNANKDAIDRIKITILNADVDNVFYVDNMYSEEIEMGNALFFGVNF